MTANRPPRKAGPPAKPFQERSQARAAALQMLYQCEVGQVSAEEAIAAHREIPQPDFRTSGDALEFAAHLVLGTTRSIEEIDPVISENSENWRPARMNVIDRLVLRMAVYQLLHMPDVPPVVVIDESVELAGIFGGDESKRFVNGILDAIRRRLADAPSRPSAE